MADLSWVGKVPVNNSEVLTRLQITGAKAGSRSSRRLGGIGWRLQEDFEAFLMMPVISWVVGLKASTFEKAGVSNAWCGYYQHNAQKNFDKEILITLLTYSFHQQQIHGTQLTKVENWTLVFFSSWKSRCLVILRRSNVVTVTALERVARVLVKDGMRSAGRVFAMPDLHYTYTYWVSSSCQPKCHLACLHTFGSMRMRV